MSSFSRVVFTNSFIGLSVFNLEIASVLDFSVSGVSFVEVSSGFSVSVEFSGSSVSEESSGSSVSEESSLSFVSSDSFSTEFEKMIF